MIFYRITLRVFCVEILKIIKDDYFKMKFFQMLIRNSLKKL